jgi:hypothetical protein
MEHRRGQRLPCDISAVVAYRSLGLVSGKARNISADGMYLDSGPIVVPKNSLVSVHFRLDGLDGRDRFEADAMVVWVGAGGMGLMFNDPSPELVLAVETLNALESPGNTVELN